MSTCPSPEELSRFEALPDERRGDLLEHVRGCAACRDAWTASDPTRLFALLSTRGVPEGILDEVSEGVFSAIDSGAPTPARRGGGFNLRAVGALAAGILFALGIVFFSGKSPEIGSPVGPVAEIAEITEIAPGASVALLDTPGEARVIDLTMGEARVVMIFDQELDL